MQELENQIWTIHEALQILSDYFLGDGRGLDVERVYSEKFREIDLMLGLAKLDTDQLITEYYRERLAQQSSMTVAEFGTVEVRVYFRYDTLCIEVFCARDVIPLDPNGESRNISSSPPAVH